MRRASWRLSSMLWAFALSACVDSLSLDGRPCPCVEGFRCCPNDGRCHPAAEECPGQRPCSEGCLANQWCYAALCVLCADNKHCGMSCGDCTLGWKDWACLGTSCGCRADADCPRPYRCLGASCQLETSDGGTDAGGGDGGGEDGGTSSHNKCCGPACLDCTGQDSDWACLGASCGCRDSADCLPDQRCEQFRCTRASDGGLDGGAE